MCPLCGLLRKEAALAYILIDEGEACLETVTRRINQLGGQDIVTSIRLHTQPSHIPYQRSFSEHWPLVLEITPSLQQYAHVKEIRIRNVRIGISSKEELDIPLLDEDFEIDTFLKWLGFDIPNLYYEKFCGNRFFKTPVSS